MKFFSFAQGLEVSFRSTQVTFQEGKLLNPLNQAQYPGTNS